MKKLLFLFILIFAFVAQAAAPVKSWRGGAAGDSTNWDNDANWKEGTKPAAGDSIVFDSLSRGSAKNCSIAVVTPELKSVRSFGIYTGGIVVKAGGKLVTNLTDSIGHTGLYIAADSVIMTGDGNFAIAAIITSINVTAGHLDLRGTGSVI